MAMRATTVEAPAGGNAVSALAGLLDTLIPVLMAVDAGTYASRPFPGVSGSIGEHVRHMLDHVATLVSSDPNLTLCYDDRKRGTAVETDPSAALRQILPLKAAVQRWGQRPLDTPVYVHSVVSSHGDLVAGWSTLARELAFVVNHTIHHQALIAMLLAVASIEVPEGLGYAPSTPRFAGA